MTKKENELTVIPYIASFEDKFIIENDLNLLLDNMVIYSYIKTHNGKLSYKPINFEIKMIDGKKVIYPLVGYANSYLLQAKRLVNATVIEIKANDYYISNCTDGDFTFVLKEK